jgi:hypothetical protein
MHAAIHRGMEDHRFGAVVCHRRFGKTVLSIAHLLVKALENPRRDPEPRYAFIAPFLGQAKSIAWEYLTRYVENIPRTEVRISELKVTLPNGGFVRLYGADNPKTFRGGYFDGVVLDEYGEMAPNVYSEILRPTLSDYGGWALFLGTPAGRNQFYEACERAKTDDTWFYACHRASETKIIPPDELKTARADMTDDEYRQEFECSFEAAVKGAIYAQQLSAARDDGRITRVPYEPLLPVDTDWDLGVGDATAIWFTQSTKSGEVRLIDYYEASGEGLPHYANVIKSKPYSYGTHWAPHDIQVREFTSGRSRIESAASLGINFKIQPKHAIEDGIHSARLLFPKCWFDEVKCRAGLEALQHYRRDYNRRLNEFKDAPIHDWSSHAADAFRGLAVRQKTPTTKRPLQVLPVAGAWLG